MGATTLLSFEDFEQLPSEPGKTELLDGELIQLPSAKKKHMKIAYRLGKRLEHLLENAIAEGGIGEVNVEMGYKFGARSWLQPDASVEHAEHAEEFRDVLRSQIAGGLEIALHDLFE